MKKKDQHLTNGEAAFMAVFSLGFIGLIGFMEHVRSKDQRKDTGKGNGCVGEVYGNAEEQRGEGGE